MTQVNIRDAKSHLSRLVARAAAGEEIVIAKAGTPVAKLVPYRRLRKAEPRVLGTLRGQIWMARDWDSSRVNEAIARAFYEDA